MTIFLLSNDTFRIFASSFNDTHLPTEGAKRKREKSISREKTLKKLNVSVDFSSSLAFIRGEKIPKTFHSFVSILATHQRKKVKENERGGGC